MTIAEGEIQAVIKDRLGRTIVAGNTIVYPTRPGGKGPLQLGTAIVKSVNTHTGTLTVFNDSERLATIDRTDRVAVITV